MGWLWSRKPCPTCEVYGTQVLCLEKINRDLELRAVRAETRLEIVQAELHRLESLPAKPAGGFLPMAAEDDEVQPMIDADTFHRRVDEVFGSGISLDEFVRRDQDRRSALREALEHERKEIAAELNSIK